MGSRRGTAAQDLSDLVCLSVTCEDCGRRNWWTREKLDEAERAGLGTVASLGRKLRCIYCAERGGGGRNLSLRAILQREADHGGQ